MVIIWHPNKKVSIAMNPMLSIRMVKPVLYYITIKHTSGSKKRHKSATMLPIQ